MADPAFVKFDVDTNVLSPIVEARISDLAQEIADMITATGLGAATPDQITSAITALGLGTASTRPASDFATPSTVNSAISALVNGAPGALDQINELAAALGNDPNYASTITTALGTKVNSSTYVAGLANKQNATTLDSDAASLVGQASTSLGAAVRAVVSASTGATGVAADPNTADTYRLTSTAGTGLRVIPDPNTADTYRIGA